MPPRLLWVDVAFTEGLPETYVLPVQILPAEAVEARRSAAPTSASPRLPGGGALCDASADEGFQRALLALVAGRKRLRDGSRGELAGVSARGARRALGSIGRGRALPGARRRAEQHVHRLQQRVFPQALPQGGGRREPRHRTDPFPHRKGRFRQRAALRRADRVPPRRAGQPVQVLAMLQSWVASEGDAWTLTIDAATRYFERVLAARADARRSRRRPHPAPARERLPDRLAGDPGNHRRHLPQPRRIARPTHGRNAPCPGRAGGRGGPGAGARAVHHALPALAAAIHRHADPARLHEPEAQDAEPARRLQPEPTGCWSAENDHRRCWNRCCRAASPR